MIYIIFSIQIIVIITILFLIKDIRKGIKHYHESKEYYTKLKNQEYESNVIFSSENKNFFIKNKSNIKNILIFKLDQLGDLIISLPVILTELKIKSSSKGLIVLKSITSISILDLVSARAAFLAS